MREISALLAANVGDGSQGATLSLTGHLVDPGGFRTEVERELTKITPGDFATKVEDHDGTIWAWIQSQIQGTGRLYPPFLVVDIGGNRKFYGLIEPSQITRDTKARQITIPAKDWSVMLASKALDEWTRPLPKVTSSRSASAAIQSHVFGAGVDEWILLLLLLGARECAFFAEPMNWAIVGDLVDIVTPAGNFSGAKIIEITHNAGSDGNICKIRFDRVIWPPHDAAHPNVEWFTGTFTRRASAQDERGYYLVTAAVAGGYELPLDTIDGIAPGDRLQLINADRAQSWTILQVDAANKKAITRDEIREIASGDRVFFTDECLQEVVFEDARTTLAKACSPFGCDLTRYVGATLSMPILSWLPLRPLSGEDLTSVRDLDGGLTTLRVFGSGAAAWDGTPEAGWATVTGGLPRAHWTDQRSTVPTSLMPDETVVPSALTPTPLSPSSPWRFFAWSKFPTITWGPWAQALGLASWAWSPAAIPPVVLYDYLAMRRIKIADRTITINAWSGSAWGSNVAGTWPGSVAVRSACVFPGGPSNMILGITSAGLQGCTLPTGTNTAVLALPANAGDAVLRSTPWGAFLVGSRGYGRITIASNVLSVAWVELVAQDGGALYPNTFTALDVDRLVALARFDSLNSEGKTVTETHAMLLQPTPTTAAASVIWDEKILDGAAITLGAMRDPSQAARVVGHCGGRLWQVSATLPVSYALERFKPSAMKASELIEHVCQLLQAVAVPDANGTMHVISRSSTETVIDITVDQVDIQETRTWEHFFSLARVGGQEGVYADAASATDGGGLLEMSNHPLLWTRSGCMATAGALMSWFGTPRKFQRETWFWSNPDTAAPWEALPPLARVRINGAATIWLVMGMDDRAHLRDGKATVSLVEVG